MPDNAHEQPIYVLKYPSRQNAQMTSSEFRCIFCFLAAMFLFLSFIMWRVKVPEFIEAGGLEMAIGLVISVISPLAFIMILVGASAAWDAYFYGQYVEIQRLLPFMERHVMYYDKMHAHVSIMDHILLNHYETRPKFWKSPYTWLKANLLYVIYIPNFCDPEIQEFAKAKAQSVSHYSFMGHKLN